MLDTSVPPPQPSAATGLRLSCLQSAGMVHLALIGELDVATTPLLHRALRRAQSDAGLVVVDLRELLFMDCSGAQLLLTAHRRARWEGTRLVIVRGPTEVDRLFALLGIDHRLELVDRVPTEAAA